MEGAGEAGKAFEEGGRGGVEVLVRKDVDAAVADGAKVVPVALGDHFFEGDAVSGAAPGEDEDVGVGGGDLVGGGVGAGLSEEAAVGGFDEFGDPGLGADEGFAPLFAIHERLGRCGCGVDAGAVKGAFDGGDEGVGGWAVAEDGGEEADVGEDVSEAVGGEGEDGVAGAEDGGEGFEAVGDAGDEEVGGCGEGGRRSRA